MGKQTFGLDGVSLNTKWFRFHGWRCDCISGCPVGVSLFFGRVRKGPDGFVQGTRGKRFAALPFRWELHFFFGNSELAQPHITRDWWYLTWRTFHA